MGGKAQSPLILCRCGCGQYTARPSWKYISGHYFSAQKRFDHGTNMGYRYGCRCEECVRARLEYGQNTNLIRRYGITREDVLTLFKSQSGLCAICKRMLNPYFDKKSNAHIDHDHLTGKVRGILCSSCNMGLGLFQDSAEIIAVAAVYITNNRGMITLEKENE